MKANKDIQVNTFQKGMMLDASDMIMAPDTARFGQNVRLVNRSGSSYVVTNLQGTDSSFVLTDGFVPVATQEFAGVLYIISWHTDGTIELGSYPSPNYSNPSEPSDVTLVYRPFNNFQGGPFRTDKYGTASKPVIQKLEIQPDYDESVNLCFTIAEQRPRIVNSKFKSANNGAIFTILPDRNADVDANAAASNTYDDNSVDEETSLILFSTQILKIDFKGITSGGKLKPGNYQYIFYYMSEDFNRTAIIGQSSTCQVSFGETVSSIRGGDESQETTKRVYLQLSNVDLDFRYIKVYALYSSGQDGLQQQYLELVQPLEVTGSTIDFYHTGFEEVNEVSQDEINLDYATIASANASTQAGGYYFLADIKQRVVDWSVFRTASYNAVPVYRRKSITVTSIGLPGYCDPENVYKYMGCMGGETYPYGIVYIMNDGSVSPVFPIRGALIPFYGQEQYSPSDNNKGLVTFPHSNREPFYDSVSGAINVKHLEFNLINVANNSTIEENTIGFFFVRGERRPNAITQGILLPTIKAPTIEANDVDFGTDVKDNDKDAGGYYVKNGDDQDDLNVFKHLINIDSVVEAYFYNRDGGSNDAVVINQNAGLEHGYMPLSMKFNEGNYSSQEDTFPAPKIWLSKSTELWSRHWALLSGDAILNQAEFVTSLQREEMGIHQLSKVNFKVGGQVTPTWQSQTFGCHYDMVGYATHYAGQFLKKIKRTVFVPSESLATGTDFISKFKVGLIGNWFSSTSAHFWVNQWYNSYFGLELDPNDGEIQDATKNNNNPIGNNSRNGKINNGIIVDVSSTYSNLNKTVPAAFLVNIYPQNQVLTDNQLYTSTDSVVYKQISPRYSWVESEDQDHKFDVFGGDCFISQVSRKLNHAPERNPSTLQITASLRWNIDSGMIVTWWQEAKYNLHLRQPKQFDASELERRSFFPYQSLGDPIAYRKYRLPETAAHSPGYSILNGPKSFFGISKLIPTIRNRFLNRIYHSEKHIPNAFRNGYRSFLELSFRDYDAGMGAIKALFNHRGMLLVVFEYGIGITSIEGRVQTGGDAAGAVFLEATSVLPPTLTYISREIGCQDHLSLVQTPGAVYGVDRARDKIWRVTDQLKVISDDGVSSWIIDNPIVNPKSGYDFENGEVIFSTDYWTLCFTEGYDKFTSFYTMENTQLFARRNKELYSFITKQSFKHNSSNTYLMYGSAREVIIEMVINKSLGFAKVMDYLNVISNEIPPTKVEWYSYNQDVNIGPTIQSGSLNQYAELDYGTDPINEEPNMLYRDKKYVVQVPYRQEYGVGSTEDKWGIEGRIRDKAVIVRLTYITDKCLELASVLNYFRYSHS